MKIVRYLDGAGRAHYGTEEGDRVLQIEGDIFGDHTVTRRAAEIQRLLAPIEVKQILGIGLNYRRHAEETNAKIPEYPILFMKGVNAVQTPGGPIVIPGHLPSAEVDYECELAVVIGRACKNVTRAQALSRPRARLHLRQRRLRPRLADPQRRRPVVPGQDLRHLRPARPAPRDPRRDPRSQRAQDRARSSTASASRTGRPPT